MGVWRVIKGTLTGIGGLTVSFVLAASYLGYRENQMIDAELKSENSTGAACAVNELNGKMIATIRSADKSLHMSAYVTRLEADDPNMGPMWQNVGPVFDHAKKAFRNGSVKIEAAPAINQCVVVRGATFLPVPMAPDTSPIVVDRTLKLEKL